MIRSLAVVASLVLITGCSSSGDGGTDPNRGPIAKADAIGSCQMSACDGQAPEGNCYCDEGCSKYGDCCADIKTYCGGGNVGPDAGVSNPGNVPEFGSNDTRQLVTIADEQDGLDIPRGVSFNPDRPSELWTVNRAFDGAVIVFDAGKATQRSEVRADAFGEHFMEEVSAFSFGDNGNFGTTHESRNTYNNAAPANDFMGPTLWESDLTKFAKVNQDRNGELSGSHIDMLHESPLSMGIAHNLKNSYWVFDGLNGHIVYYDFQRDHGPGAHDHSDGIVRRYVEVAVKRVANIPSNLFLDKTTGWLYIADTGNQRVLRMDTKTGAVDGTYRQTSEPLAEYSRVQGVTSEEFVKTGLVAPSGIWLAGDRLFVSDNATGEIVAFDDKGAELGRIATGAPSIMGITVGPEDGKLYFVDGKANLLVRVDP